MKKITKWKDSDFGTPYLYATFYYDNSQWEIRLAMPDKNYMILKPNPIPYPVLPYSNIFVFYIKTSVILSIKESHILRTKLEKSLNLCFKLNLLKREEVIDEKK